MVFISFTASALAASYGVSFLLERVRGGGASDIEAEMRENHASQGELTRLLGREQSHSKSAEQEMGQK